MGNQYLQPPPDYDPRRLFPFGLSPIPEVPSEFASEVSSIASYSPTPSLDDSDTEAESGRSRGSIMYSGSCDSIKSNNTLHGKSSSESDTDTEHDSSDEDTEDEADGYVVEGIPIDNSVIVKDNLEEPQFIKKEIVQIVKEVNEIKSVENNYDEEYAEIEEEQNEIIDPIVVETHSVPCDMVSGAATASEIFRHLQATRGKQEVTTELAKILTVLKSTLSNNDKDSSSSDDENTTNSDKSTNPNPIGKPPKPPQKIKFAKNSVVSPAIQARIRDLESNKQGNPKEEMNLLSKILVHLLCSCKNAAAAQELKRIIRQFKEVAKVAMEEGDDTLESIRSSSRASSRSSKRRARSRTASGNSNVSGNSETDSLNTLTPGDSKSSGTDDETNQENNTGKLRFTSNVNCEKNTEALSCVSYTLTLPLKQEEEEDDEDDDEEGEYDDDEEWEWEYEDELETSTPTKNDSSGSSRNLTPSEAKSDISTGSTRKIFNDMELGAYNSHSDPGNSNSHSTPITEEDDVLLDDEEEFRDETARKEKSENSEHLFSHLEETFKVLSDTYKIITTGNSPECDINSQNSAMIGDHNDSDISFEDILDGVSSQCVQLESEIMRSSRQSTAEPDGFDVSVQQISSKPNSRPSSRTNSRPSSRTNSRLSSRPASRNKIKTPVPPPDPEGQDQEEDWGDEDEWEYYYEEECETQQPEDSKVTTSRPASRIMVRSRPASRQEVEEYLSRPDPRHISNGNKSPDSRPASRIVKRPASVASRPVSRAVSRCSSIKQVEEEEDWGDEDEWEYYYEEDYPEETVQTNQVKIKSRPSSRQNNSSRVPSRQECVRVVSRQDNTIRVSSRQDNVIRVSSRQELDQQRPLSKQEVDHKRVPSRQEMEEKRVPSRNASRTKSRAEDSDTARVPSRVIVRVPSRNSRPASTATSAVNGEEDEDAWEYYYEEDEHNSATGDSNEKQASRPSSRQSVNQSRPNSRSGSRPVSRSGSRPGSRANSRMKTRTTSSLGNVDEEDEYESYYDDEDDMELLRFSPTLTTAPTTRATSPFPDEKGKVEHNTGTGFSKRKMSAILESEETTPVPNARTPTNREGFGSATPIQGSRSAMSKTPSAMQTEYLNPMAGVSVALAAEYLGQDAQQLVNSLPVDFIEENIERRKKNRHRRKEEDTDNGEEKKRRKKKKDKKFLPKVGVKELASRLEPQLFQDMQVGNKMILTKEEASGIIRESKRKTKEDFRETSSKPISPSGSRAEEERKSVSEMVQLMSNHNLGMDRSPNESSSPPHHSMSIPSISVSSQMVAPPIPPPPQAYYSSPGPQYPPGAYQPYPVDVHAQYSQYQQSPHSPYQQYPPPPQSPYHQYPPQQYYQGYPPPPPQAYQQYPQQYPQYHPQQMQPYPNYPQGYQQPQQPMVYQSDCNPNQVKVVSGGQTTVVTMRQKSKAKDTVKQKSPENQRTSPNDSEAYGTGSTGSDQTEGQVVGIDHDEGKEGEEGSGKPHKRHSRLFKLLQDSDYTDSDADSRTDYSRISMKNMEDNHSRESDIDSVCSGLEKSNGIERKHSFRSHKSSNKESDSESVTSSGIERKISPNAVQNNVKHRRFMQLNLQTTYEPSSSELSTPNSPTGPGPVRRNSSSKPPARVWNYHADDFDSHAGVSDDSSYQSLQSLNSFDSIYDNIAGREVEEIMKRKVNRDGMYRYQPESPSGYVRASPKGVDYLRGSPKTSSPSFNRNSPKLEQELLELTNFPNSPGLSLRQLHGHRSFYGGK